ncbi:MAG: DUF6644 family protein [Gemmatimonadaceae bacterium]
MLKPWADFYSHSKGTETVVQALHIGGLLLGGGFGVAADRGSLRAMRVQASERTHYVQELAAVHVWVLTGLTIVALSGVAMLTADIETFFGSWIFWTKMALVIALLINGYIITRVENGLIQDSSDRSPHWGTMHKTAVVSLVLWFTITIAGVSLVNLT